MSLHASRVRVNHFLIIQFRSNICVAPFPLHCNGYRIFVCVGMSCSNSFKLSAQRFRCSRPLMRIASSIRHRSDELIARRLHHQRCSYSKPGRKGRTRPSRSGTESGPRSALRTAQRTCRSVLLDRCSAPLLPQTRIRAASKQRARTQVLIVASKCLLLLGFLKNFHLR